MKSIESAGADKVMRSPKSPADYDWSKHFPAYVDEAAVDDDSTPKPLTKDVDIIDVGCGFGGLLMALSPKLPDQLLLGPSRSPLLLKYQV